MITQIAEVSDSDQHTKLNGEVHGESRALHEPNVASHRLHIIMPVLNEASALHVLLPELPPKMRECTIIVDNGSDDGSATVAAWHGVRVVREAQRGYGAACLAGIAALPAPGDHDLVLFMDGDASDDVADIPRLLQPLYDGRADLVIGSRVLGARDRGALPVHARFGNWLATTLIQRKTGLRFTDLGPLRALRFGTLRSLEMQDRNFGWTVEMQMKAAQRGLRVCELPVHYRKRVGRSKISGTIGGSVRAGFTILHTIAKHGR